MVLAFTGARNEGEGGIGRGRGDDFSLKVYGTIQALRSGMPLDIRAWSLERGLVQL